MPIPQQGEEAPEFMLEDQGGVERSLEDYRGSWILLYFYPKDDTPGCTKEACALRDEFPAFENIDAVILGVSTDSVASHHKFAQKYELPFTLLADENKKVVELYGVWQKKKMMGKEYMGTVRTSFLIDPDGMIAKVYENVKPEVHAREVLTDLETLQSA
jgi:peroxiredoxin Q/BCP